MRLIVGLLTALAALVATAPSAVAQAPTVVLKPNSGKAGSGFTIGWSGFRTCRVIAFTWAGTALVTSPAAPPESGQVNATVPADAKPGVYVVTGHCPNQKLSASANFTVTDTPTTTSSPRPSVTRVPPVTTRPPVTPVTPVTPTTTKPSTPVTSTTPPSSTVDTTEPTSSAPPSGGNLVLDRSTINPGDPLSARGRGCIPNSPVTLTSKGVSVGTAVADATGAFVAPVEFTRVEPGRHIITASCGVVLTGAVDQVVTSTTGGQSSTLVILVFFVLAGAALIRFSA